MIKRWIYGLFMIVLFGIGLAVGAANDASVSFDFLFVKKEVSLGTVLIIGMIFGLIAGLYISLWASFKYWRQARVAKAQVRRLEKELSSKSEAHAEQ